MLALVLALPLVNFILARLNPMNSLLLADFIPIKVPLAPILQLPLNLPLALQLAFAPVLPLFLDFTFALTDLVQFPKLTLLLTDLLQSLPLQLILTRLPGDSILQLSLSLALPHFVLAPVNFTLTIALILQLALPLQLVPLLVLIQSPILPPAALLLANFPLVLPLLADLLTDFISVQVPFHELITPIVEFFYVHLHLK